MQNSEKRERVIKGNKPWQSEEANLRNELKDREKERVMILQSQGIRVSHNRRWQLDKCLLHRKSVTINTSPFTTFLFNKIIKSKLKDSFFIYIKIYLEEITFTVLSCVGPKIQKNLGN